MATLSPSPGSLGLVVLAGYTPPAWQTPLEEGGQGAHQGPALNAPPNHPRGGWPPRVFVTLRGLIYV